MKFVRQKRLLITILASFPLFSQDAGFKITDNVDLVLLDVSVRNQAGTFAERLPKSDFQVFEDGHPRSISHFETADAPVSLGLVVDNSGSMRLKRPEIVTAGLAFAKQSNRLDEFFVVNFNDSVVSGLPSTLAFTDNWQLLRKALYYGEPAGRTALYDAILYSLQHLELSRREKRTLIVVSDGRDNVSKTTYNQLVTAIEASRATIYTVGLYDPDSSDLKPAVLRKIAKISGGEFFEPHALLEVTPIFDKISREIRHRYTIGYVPDEIGDKRITRTVKVIVRQNGRSLPVRTRTTYSTQPGGSR